MIHPGKSNTVAAWTAALSAVAWIVLAPPASALSDTAQVMSGGNTFAEPAIIYTAPGFPYVHDPDSIAVNKGEKGVQLSMPAGTLSQLRVRVTTQSSPTSGALT